MSNRRTSGASVAYKLIAFACALLLVATGLMMLVAVFRGTGFRNHWRIIIATQFAEAVFDALQRQQADWQGE